MVGGPVVRPRPRRRRRVLPVTPLLDRRARPLRDLRISLTDRCNFRCGYCMPRDLFGADHAFLERDELLSFDEIEEVVRAAADLGVTTVRLTGGEPLMRAGAPGLVARLAAIGGLDLAMTTNGVLLPRHAGALAAAGLSRLTVSLDAIDDVVFRRASDSPFAVSAVMAGIDAAVAAGFDTVKVNAVVRRGVNEHQVVPLVEHFRGTGHELRFIEFMDVGATNGWTGSEVVPAAEIRAAIETRWRLEDLPARRHGEVARRFRLADGTAQVGIISSVSSPFCGTCTRARVTADGRVHTCLFSSRGTDLRPLLRGARHEGDLRRALAGLWNRRDDRYSELRAAGGRVEAPVEMSYIGG